jgi:hypothetical protein
VTPTNDGRASIDLWLMCIDADFVCGRGLASCLLRAAREAYGRGDDGTGDTTALVVAAFECVREASSSSTSSAFSASSSSSSSSAGADPPLPRDMATLRACHHAMHAAPSSQLATRSSENWRVLPFQSVQCPEAHERTDYARWWREHTAVVEATTATLTAKATSAPTPTPTPVPGPTAAAKTLPDECWTYRAGFAPKYEPYVCVRARSPRLPRFDERFTGYGYNKMAFAAALHRSGYDFRVVLGDRGDGGVSVEDSAAASATEGSTITPVKGIAHRLALDSAFVISRRHPPSRACRRMLASPRARVLKQALYDVVLSSPASCVEVA